MKCRFRLVATLLCALMPGSSSRPPRSAGPNPSRSRSWSPFLSRAPSLRPLIHLSRPLHSAPLRPLHPLRSPPTTYPILKAISLPLPPLPAVIYPAQAPHLPSPHLPLPLVSSLENAGNNPLKRSSHTLWRWLDHMTLRCDLPHHVPSIATSQLENCA